MVERAIARNRRTGHGTDFWSLALPAETRGFVPKLIAVSKIVANPAGHKLSLRPIPDKPYLAEVEVGRQIRLTEAARLAGVSVEEMRRLNSGLIQSITAPSGPHRLAVPVDRAPAFRRRLAGYVRGPQKPAKTPSPARRAVSLGQRVDDRRLAVMSVPGWFGDPTHRVRAGDTLWDISQTYRVPLAALCEANQLSAKAAGIKTRLRPGQDLLIPGGTGGRDERGPKAPARTSPHPAGRFFTAYRPSLPGQREPVAALEPARRLSLYEAGQRARRLPQPSLHLIRTTRTSPS